MRHWKWGLGLFLCLALVMVLTPLVLSRLFPGGKTAIERRFEELAAREREVDQRRSQVSRVITEQLQNNPGALDPQLVEEDQRLSRELGELSDERAAAVQEARRQAAASWEHQLRKAIGW